MPDLPVSGALRIGHLPSWRMQNLGLTAPRAGRPEDVVRHLLAMQSQDYAPAKWSIGQRLVGVDEGAVEAALAEGRILRTHVLRPTWHFVLPEDIRWLLELTGPRIQLANRHRYRQLELDDATLARGSEVMGNTVASGAHRTRGELAAVLERAGISTTAQRLPYLLMNAELSGVICSGPSGGKHQTYALLAERAPKARRLGDDEALAELTYRYFASHGPSTERDMSWWSSLTLAQCRRGLAAVADRLERAHVDGVVYHAAEPPPSVMTPPPGVQLIQGYDEYIVGYRATKWILDLSGSARWSSLNRPVFNAAVLRDGQVVGAWKRTVAPNQLTVQVRLAEPFDDPAMAALQSAADAHGTFLGVPARLDVLDERLS